MTSDQSDRIHFVTGRLAEHALRRTLQDLSQTMGFGYSVDVLPITVAALMTPKWIERKWSIPTDATRIVIPGYCEGDLTVLQQATSIPVERGPRDLRQLPEFFGQSDASTKDYGQLDIEIIAEINHAPQLELSEILDEAQRLADSGADIVDVGCDPGSQWRGVGDCVKALREAGHRVSIDSLDVCEIEQATKAGAELVLSVNSANRDAAVDWGCEVVAIPDDPETILGLDDTIEMLATTGVPLRIDPILEPIGCGFAASLGRYIATRKRYPDAEMMMGIGNLTELTDVDSAGVNFLLLGICQELGIRSILTTQVINWARTSVKECDLARRAVYYAINNRVPPKHCEPDLVTLRDAKLYEYGAEELDQLAANIKDNNYRLFAESGMIHLIAAGIRLEDADPFMLFKKLLAINPKNIDASHAFYLGFEMAKAATALTLSKSYRQDEALDWGYLTVEEKSHRLKMSKSPRSDDVPNQDKVGE